MSLGCGEAPCVISSSTSSSLPMLAAASSGVEPGRVAAERVSGAQVSRPNRATCRYQRENSCSRFKHFFQSNMGRSGTGGAGSVDQIYLVSVSIGV